MVDRYINKSRGFAFIHFEDIGDAIEVRVTNVQLGQLKKNGKKTLKVGQFPMMRGPCSQFALVKDYGY